MVGVNIFEPPKREHELTVSTGPFTCQRVLNPHWWTDNLAMEECDKKNNHLWSPMISEVQGVCSNFQPHQSSSARSRHYNLEMQRCDHPSVAQFSVAKMSGTSCSLPLSSNERSLPLSSHEGPSGSLRNSRSGAKVGLSRTKVGFPKISKGQLDFRRPSNKT